MAIKIRSVGGMIVDQTSGLHTSYASGASFYSDWLNVQGVSNIGVFWRIGSLSLSGTTAGFKLEVEHAPQEEAEGSSVPIIMQTFKDSIDASNEVAFTNLDSGSTQNVAQYRILSVPAGYVRFKRSMKGTDSAPSVSHEIKIHEI